ncbi:MAG: hypothetical protein OXI74_05430 [Rhodospirillaceae bacterium]|nr:hypothetical protein [Rhodospirillaceae bacterium]
MIDLPSILNSAFGSLLAGIVLLSSAPLWWKWLKRVEASSLKKKLEPAAIVGGLLGLLLLLGSLLSYQEQSSIPRYHPDLSD